MDFPPFVMVYHKQTKSPIHAEPKHFDVDLGKQMHVFVDVEPKKIINGIHEIKVYGHPCRLYKWIAQGYHRGLVVLMDDEVANNDADVYRQSGTWSWMLRDE